MDNVAPGTVRIRGSHLSGLDGLRALAVLGVVAYHLHLRVLAGGYLGVDLFFVLSGFLITSLLVEERIVTGGLSFAAFWARRARRLLPALFVVLAAVALFVAVTSHFRLAGFAVLNTSTLRGDSLATLLYVSNWHLIATNQGYFNHFGFPSPLEHTWSLAIEEQFYVAFPFLAAGLLALRRRARWRTLASGLLLVGAAASLLEMALLYRRGVDPTRVYFGTDTRAFDLLIGAALGFAVAGRDRLGERASRALAIAAWPAGAVLAGFWVLSGDALEMPKPYMYRGGFALCALLAAVMIAAVVERPESAVARALSLRPLVAVGVVSYGIYLWHWPVIVLINPLVTGQGRWVTDVIRLALLAVLTVASYRLVERPIRRSPSAPLRVAAMATVSALATAVVCLVATSLWALTPAGLQPVRTFPVLGVPPSGAVPGAGGFAGQVPLHVDHEVTARHPLRVGFLGDSLMRLSFGGIEAALRSTRTVVTASAARPGRGLTTQGANLDGQLERFLHAFHPDVIVGTWLWDNQAAAADPAGYRARLEHAIEVLLTGPDRAQGVALVPFPTIQPPPALDSMPGQALLLPQLRTAAWNAAIAAVARAHPGTVMVLPVSRSVLLDGRRYATWLAPGNQPNAPYGSWVRVRRTDGIHLCQNGTVRFATALAADLHALFGSAQPQGTWWRGAWTTTSDYQGTSASDVVCPGDHPPAGTTPAHPAPPGA